MKMGGGGGNHNPAFSFSQESVGARNKLCHEPPVCGSRSPEHYETIWRLVCVGRGRPPPQPHLFPTDTASSQAWLQGAGAQTSQASWERSLKPRAGSR